MAKLLRMPGISADAEEVVFLEWSVKPGNKIQNGEAIALVETEKANVDIVADQDAILWKSLIEPGKSVNVGAPIEKMKIKLNKLKQKFKKKKKSKILIQIFKIQKN